MEDYLDLDSKSAVTIFAYVDVARSNPLEELGMVDLENHVSEAIWKLYDNARGEAAERLGVNEVDLLLADARVLGVKLDGDEVLSPEGFTGRKLEVLLSITMVRRDKFVEAQFLCEGGSVRAFVLGREKKLKEALYVEAGEDSTVVYHITPLKVGHLANLDWGARRIPTTIAEGLGLQSATAERMHGMYIDERTSEHVARKLDKLVGEALAGLVEGLGDVIKNDLPGRARGIPPVYFRSFAPITDKIYKKRFALGRRRLSFLPVDVEVEVAQFVEDDMHKTYKELNQLAQRRIKWLMPDG